jgi:hypothetical protein
VNAEAVVDAFAAARQRLESLTAVLDDEAAVDSSTSSWRHAWSGTGANRYVS